MLPTNLERGWPNARSESIAFPVPPAFRLSIERRRSNRRREPELHVRRRVLGTLWGGGGELVPIRHSFVLLQRVQSAAARPHPPSAWSGCGPFARGQPSGAEGGPVTHPTIWSGPTLRVWKGL